MNNSNETSFYQDDEGKNKYNSFCKKCLNSCKQSFKAKIVTCPNFEVSKQGRKANN